MPSRAVKKKLARREAKRARGTAAPDGVEEGANCLAKPLKLAARPAVVSELARSVVELPAEKRRRENEARDAAAIKRHRIEKPSASTVDMPVASDAAGAADTPVTALADRAEDSGTSRKDRKRQEAAKRLERQMTRLHSETARATLAASSVAPDASNHPVGENSEEIPTTGTTPALRHDPKYINGTFWKERKDRKRRTLFVGNLPVTSTKGTIAELVDAVLGANTEEKSSDTAIDGIEILPVKYGARVVHAYVTFKTLELSNTAQSLLSDLPVGPNKLRVNNAADKQQRAVAIAKRTGSVELSRSRPPPRRNTFQPRRW